MATKRETPLEQLKRRRGIKTTSPTTTSSDKLENQVKNYKTRLDNIGVDAEEVTDNRNALEKFLNLKKDQNVLFDIFELLDRPRNALFSGIQSSQEGDSFWEGAKEGIKGNKEVSGKDLLMDNFDMEDEEGKINLVDVLGFGADIALDPTNWALFGGKSISDAAMGLAGKAVKKTAKVTDKAVEAGLKGIDNINAKKIAKLVDKGATEAEAIAKLNINPNKLGLYRDLKKGAKNILDSSSNIGGFVGRSRQYDSEKGLMNLFGEQALDEIKKDADTIAKNIGISKDELMTKVVNAIESNKDWSLRGQDIINKFKENKTIDLLTSKQASDVKNALDSFGIKTSLDGTGTKLHLDENNLSKLYTIQDAPLGESTFKDAIFGSKNDEEITNLLKSDKDFFNSTPELQQFYNKAEKAVSEFASATSDINKGLDAGSAATNDYVKHSLTDETRRRIDSKEFKSRETEWDMSIAQANKKYEQERLENLAKAEAALDRNRKAIYKTELDEAGNEILSLDEAGNYIRDDNKYKKLLNDKENLVNTLEKSLASNEEVLKYANNKDFNPALLNKKGQKAISQIDRLAASKAEVDTISNEIAEHLKEVKAMKDVTPDSLEALNELTKTYNEFSKKYTELKNQIPKMFKDYKKGNLDELGGYLPANEQITKLFEPLTSLRNKVRGELTISKAITDDSFKKAIREQLKSSKTGQALGEKLTKKTANVKRDLEKVSLIKKTTEDSIINLDRKLNFQKQALENLKDVSTKESIANKATDAIKHYTEQIELLKSQEGQTFFKTKFDEIFPDYIKAASSQNAGTKKFYDALANNLFDNDEYIRIYDGENIPYDFVKMNGNNLINKYNAYSAIMTDEGKELGNILNKFKDKNIIIDKQFATALDVASKKNPQQVGPLLKVWDGINNTFKKFSTLTPGFHVRNILGNSTDMVLSGMNPAAIPTYYKKANKLWNKADDLISKARQGILSADEAKQFDILKQFYQGGFVDALQKGYGLEDVSKAVKSSTKNPINKVSKFSMDVNNKVDAYNRLALLMYANDNPKYLAKLGKDNAVDAVKYVLFDPNNMSETEQAFKRIIPFYTFTKQNLYFQASNLMKNTGKYKALYKGLESMYNDLDEDAYYNYQKQGMQIPLPFLNDDGTQMFLKSNLPVSDLGEFLSNPVQRIVSSTSPLIKTPFEKVTGVDTFTGQELHFDTLSGYTDKIADKLGIDGKGARNKAELAELILKNFGLSNFSTNLLKKVETALDYAEGDASGQQVWSEILRSVVQTTNEENVRNSGLYDELEAYQAEIKRLKNQGIDVPTIKEITASNKLKLNNLKNKRAKSK